MKNSVEAGPLAARLAAQGEVLGTVAVERATRRLAARDQPDGVTAEAVADAVRLSGRGLKLRIVRDPAIGRVER